VLLDFGLAVMSDEQRRTSLRKAGAVEFMAPEQNEGETLFQTDVYSFGVIIFELLAGRVPFPLADKGETARNHVRLAHMETLPPDLMSLRKEHMPAIWPNDKKEREMQVPDWLVKLVYTCLKKKPDNRFRNGIELHDFIIHHATHTTNQAVSVVPAYTPATSDREKEQLQYQLSQYKQQMATMQRELDDLKSGQLPGTGVVASTQTYQSSYNQPVNNGVSKTSFIVLLLLTLGLAAFSAYSLLKNNSPSTNDVSTTTNITDTSGTGTLPVEDLEEQRRIQKREEDLAKQRRIDSIAAVEKAKADAAAKQATEGTTTETPVTGTNTETPQTTTEPPRSGSGGVQYMVVSKAYFYNSPDETTRRNAFVVPGNNAIVSAQEEQNDFVYVVFTNTQGQTSKGWLRKKDLQQLSE
jgi:serine/threonine-protein kinase